MAKPTRAERERELQTWMQSNAARLLQIYKQAAGIQPGESPPAGTLGSTMIATILDKEYGP